MLSYNVYILHQEARGEWGEGRGGPGLVSNLYFLVLRRHISDSGKKFKSNRRQKEGRDTQDLLTVESINMILFCHSNVLGVLYGQKD